MVIKAGLTSEGYSEDEIEEELADIDKLGNWEKKAKVYLKKLQAAEKEQKEALVEAQKQHAKRIDDENKAQFEAFKKGLFDKDSIAGFKFTPKLKTDLWDYMTKVVNKKTGETQYLIDSKSNEDARYMFAYLLKNKWDVKSLERQVSSKEVSKLRGKLANYSDSGAKAKSVLRERVKEASNDGNFSAFKDFLNQ
jgi:hypothetical protein